MQFDEIKNKLNDAINKVINEDHHLLIHDLNEPAISHRLAMYLTKQFYEFDVDCEYNGDINSENGKKIIHILKQSAQNQGLRCNTSNIDDEFEDRLVYPDIIVHKRGLNGPDNNLIVIEVKKTSSSVNGKWDAEKLSRFTSQLFDNNFGYQFGAFVRFGVKNQTGSYQVEWYENGVKIPAIVESTNRNQE